MLDGASGTLSIHPSSKSNVVLLDSRTHICLIFLWLHPAWLAPETFFKFRLQQGDGCSCCTSLRDNIELRGEEGAECKGKVGDGEKSVEAALAGRNTNSIFFALEQQSHTDSCVRQPEAEKHSGPETPQVTGEVSVSVTIGRCGQMWQRLKVNCGHILCRPWWRLRSLLLLCWLF